MTLVVRDAVDDAERAWANAQYDAIKFERTKPTDVQLVAELDGQRVGLGRLVALDETKRSVELGGIWTHESARGRGVARAVVDRLLREAQAGGVVDVWCVPFEHLVAFYESCGFARVPSSSSWHSRVQHKVELCIASQLPPVAVLRR